MYEFNQYASWVYWVVVEKEGDKIVDVEWNAFNIQGDANATYKGMDKYQASVEHIYNMRNDGLWWHEQAELLIDKLIETQDVNDRIPVPAGASIDSTDFYALVEKALASDPVEKGEYKDGYYFKTLKNEGEEHASVNYWDPQTETVRSTGVWDAYTFGSFVVVNGRIVMAYYNNVFYGYRVQFNEQGKIVKQEVDIDNDPETPAVKLSVIAPYASATPTLYKTKNELGLSYGMSVVSGQKEYDEQARLTGEYLVKNQMLPEVDENGDFDGVAGVTITASDFVNLWKMLPKAE